MGSIELPPQLAVGQGHGKVTLDGPCHLGGASRLVPLRINHRAVYVPPAAVLPDLVELAGGPQKVIGQAARHLAAGRPLHALHLAEAPSLLIQPRSTLCG